MDTRLNNRTRAEADLPDLLTVEEAARLIRVGRTKAYAMAREWRDTEGRSGLPVVDFGHLLRVPRHALEALIGAELTGTVVHDDGEPASADPIADTAPTPSSATSPEPVTPRPRPRRARPTNQLDLFDSSPTS